MEARATIMARPSGGTHGGRGRAIAVYPTDLSRKPGGVWFAAFEDPIYLHRFLARNRESRWETRT
jgi:hypothetical protein